MSESGISNALDARRALGRFEISSIALSCPNVVVLDEITNGLDIDSRNALVAAIGAFRGTVIISSHSYDFLRETCSMFYAFNEGTVRRWMGTLDEYKQAIVASLETFTSRVLMKQVGHNTMFSFIGWFPDKK